MLDVDNLARTIAAVAGSRAVARFYFHTRNGRLFRDAEGLELRDVEAARSAAFDFLIDMMPSVKKDFWVERSFQIIVQDDTGMTLFTLELFGIESPAVNPLAGRRA